MSHHLVSIVIPVYNRARIVEAALSSVAEQDYPNLEVVIVDDGSKDSDDLRQVVHKFASNFLGDVRLIRQENAGSGAARNRGLSESRGTYIQYLDSDDLLLPGKISAQVEALQADPEAVMCYGVAYEEYGGNERKERKMARNYVPDLLEAALQWRRWSTNGALWRYPNVPGWRERPWWGTSRAGQDVVHDVRVGCIGRKVLFVDTPSSLARLVTTDHTSHSKQPDLVRTRWQVIDDCHKALEESGLLSDSRYARPFAERCFHAGLYLAAHDELGLARDLLRRAFLLYPDYGLKVDVVIARLINAVVRWPFSDSMRGRIIRAFFRRRRHFRPEWLHVNRSL